MTIRTKTYIAIGIFASCTACANFLDINPPVNQVAASQVFSTDEAALSALTGLYSETMNSNSFFLNGGLTLYGGLSAGELIDRLSSTNRQEFSVGEISNTNSDNEFRLWRKAYELIYHCNSLLEGAASAQLTPKTKETVQGEALFFRALCYFYLVNLYGAVPWVTTTDSEANTAISRSPVETIYTNIEADLLVAEKLVTLEYQIANRARPNKNTIQALLARLYLYRGEWDKAASYANLVLTSPHYQLEDQLDQVFRYNSAEVIWQLYPVNNSFNATAESQLFLPPSPSGLPSLLLSEAVLDQFEPGDKRRDTWVGIKTYLGNDYYFANKYRVYRGEEMREEYNVMFRLAEQYLIRAEARLNQGDLAGALDDLNRIRQRAGLVPIQTADEDVFMDVLIHEKSIEFLTEFGHRWLDYKRWGIVDAYQYPIPQYELDSNPLLND